MGGKLDVVCFDKTGTLTEDGLDVLGARTVRNTHRLVFHVLFASSLASDNQTHDRFSELLSETSAGLLCQTPTAKTPYDIEKQQKIIYIMATCHSLRVIDGELLGDPLDVKMFQFTGWSYDEGGDHASEQTGPSFDTIVPSVAKPPRSRDESQQNSPGVSQSRGFVPDGRLRSHFIAGPSGARGSAEFRIRFSTPTGERGCPAVW